MSPRRAGRHLGTDTGPEAVRPPCPRRTRLWASWAGRPACRALDHPGLHRCCPTAANRAAAAPCSACPPRRRAPGRG
jgi:hypothetical protein